MLRDMFSEKLGDDDQEKIIYGYKFPLNSLGSGLTASDKAGASDIMKAHKIPHIRTRLLLNPSLGPWAAPGGVWPSIHHYASTHHRYDVVCKPKDGSGGVDVIHSKNGRDMEAAIQKIFATGKDAVICGYKPIAREIRVIVLNGVPEVIFVKIPPYIVGDGEKTTQALIEKYLVELPESRRKIINVNIEPSLRDSQKTPDEGEKIRLLWKFNLGQGATAMLLGGHAVHLAKNEDDVEDLSLTNIIDLALRATKVLNINFGSADVVEVVDEPKPEKKWRIMEVNSGVMMDNLMSQQGDFEKKIATQVFSDVISAMFPNK